MGDWRRYFSTVGGGDFVHPHAPAGGAGRGSTSRFPGYHEGSSHDVPHPDSPAGRTFNWSLLPHIDIDDRAQAVLESIRVARRHAPAAIQEASGEELGAIVEGIIPGLLLGLCVVAATTTLGAAAGMAIGALAAGVGAAPSAFFGAGLGLEAGIALLEGLGLAFLAAAIGSSLLEATKLAARAVSEAWNAVDDPRSRWFHVEHAGKTLASALGVMIRGVLQGIVAFLVAKGASTAASRVPELVAKLRMSRLGAGFATWVERNWASLLNNKRLQQSEPRTGGGGGGGTKRPAPGDKVSKSTASATRPASGREPSAAEPSAVSKVTRPSFEETYAKAPAAKQEVDAVADDVARSFDGRVAKAPVKSRARALEKINNDYGGDPTKIKDLARNTIVVRADRVDAVANDLAARGASVKRIDPSSNPMGYSGVNATMPTKSGLTAEIQVNSPEMIYAKEPAPIARSILGDAAYDDIATRTGVSGGQGHALYEQYRQLPEGSSEAGRLAEQSRAYYDSVRAPVDGH